MAAAVIGGIAAQGALRDGQVVAVDGAAVMGGIAAQGALGDEGEAPAVQMAPPESVAALPLRVLRRTVSVPR